MKKYVIPGLIVVIVILILIISVPKESDYTLHLVVDSWSDQDMDYPEEEFTFQNITLFKKYVIPLEGDKDYLLREFRVVKISKNSFTISTPIPLSNNENGIDLNSKKKKFVVEEGKTLKLDTLITDAGEVYQFRIE